MRHVPTRRLLPLLCLLMLAGCAPFGSHYEPPTVVLSSFRALPSEGMVPAFEVGLRVINPNPQALNLQGIVYTISLQGHEVVKGVGKDYPVIEGYSEELLTLTAAPNLLAGIRLLTDMLNSAPGEDSLAARTLRYDFDARLDLGSGLRRSIKLRESGELNLGSSTTDP